MTDGATLALIIVGVGLVASFHAGAGIAVGSFAVGALIAN